MSSKIEGVCANCQAAFDRHEGRMLCEDDKIHRDCFERIRPRMKPGWRLLLSYGEREMLFGQPNRTIMQMPIEEFRRGLGVGHE